MRLLMDDGVEQASAGHFGQPAAGQQGAVEQDGQQLEDQQRGDDEGSMGQELGAAAASGQICQG